MPHNEQGRPGARGGLTDEQASGRVVTATVPPFCPCGCVTKPPYLDDERCIRHRPIIYDYHLYDRPAVAV